MGFPLPPRRSSGQRAPLNVASDETFAAWLALPKSDHRTIEEFAEAGELPIAREDRRTLLDPGPIVYLGPHETFTAFAAGVPGTDSTGCR